jgi:hypothetical protein
MPSWLGLLLASTSTAFGRTLAIATGSDSVFAGLVEAYAEYDWDHVKLVLNVIALEVGRDVLRPDNWGAAGDVIAKHITADEMEGTPFRDYVRELVEEEEAAAWASTPTGRAEMYADRLFDEWKHDAA